MPPRSPLLPVKMKSQESVPAPASKATFQLYASRIIECPSRNAATENSIGIVGTSIALGVRLEDLATLVEDVVHDARSADARQVVGLEHPLVVLDDLLTRTPEAIRRRDGRVERVDDPVVEADHREV